MRTSNIELVRKTIRASIIDKHGTVTKFAEKNGTTLQYVSNVLTGIKPIPEWMLKKFHIKYVRRVTETWEIPS